jgi:hypothetical protein
VLGYAASLAALSSFAVVLQQLSPEEEQGQRYASLATSRLASRSASLATSAGTQVAIMIA